MTSPPPNINATTAAATYSPTATEAATAIVANRSIPKTPSRIEVTALCAIKEAPRTAADNPRISLVGFDSRENAEETQPEAAKVEQMANRIIFHFISESLELG